MTSGSTQPEGDSDKYTWLSQTQREGAVWTLARLGCPDMGPTPAWISPRRQFLDNIDIYLFFKYILLIMLLQLSYFFSPLFPSALYLPLPPSFPQLSSCPCVIPVSSLASPFPTLFLTSPCLFSTYHLCFLFPVPFPPYSLLPLPIDNPPCDLHFCDSVLVLVVCLVCFCFLFFLGSAVNSCEFVVILLFTFLISFS